MVSSCLVNSCPVRLPQVNGCWLTAVYSGNGKDDEVALVKGSVTVAGCCCCAVSDGLLLLGLVIDGTLVQFVGGMLVQFPNRHGRQSEQYFPAFTQAHPLPRLHVGTLFSTQFFQFSDFQFQFSEPYRILSVKKKSVYY